MHYPNEAPSPVTTNCSAKKPAATQLLLFGLSIVVALASTAFLGRFSSPDRWEYSVIAQNILDGRGALYPFLGTDYFFYGSGLYSRALAGVLLLTGGSESAMIVVQCILFAVSCLVVERIARRAFQPLAAAFAALLAILHPGGLVYVGRLHSQTLDATLLIALFWLMLRVTVRTRAVKAFGVGALAGLAVSSRGNILVFCAAWAAWFLFRHRDQLPDSVRVVGAMALGGVIVLSPIWAEGYSRYGTLIALRTDNGINLWTGNHHDATGTSFTSHQVLTPAIDARPVSLTRGIEGLSEVEQNRAFIDASLRFTQRHPLEFVSLYFRKLVYFWWFTPHTGVLYPVKWLDAYRIYYFGVLPLAIVGLFAALRSRDEYARICAQTFLLLAVTMSASQAMFYVDGRHRWELEPLLLLFVSGGVLHLSSCVASFRSGGIPSLVRSRVRVQYHRRRSAPSTTMRS